MEEHVQAGDEAEPALRRVRQAGAGAAGIGVALVLVALLLPAEFTGDFRAMAGHGAPWPYWLRAGALRATWLLWVVSGALLVIGGLAFARAMEWARQMLAGVMAYSIVHYAAVLLALDTVGLRIGRWERGGIIWAAAWQIVFLALIWVFWRALRYLRSERVRQVCSVSVPQ